MRYIFILFLLMGCGRNETVYVHDSKKINCYWDIPLDCYACEYIYDDAVVIKCQ